MLRTSKRQFWSFKNTRKKNTPTKHLHTSGILCKKRDFLTYVSYRSGDVIRLHSTFEYLFFLKNMKALRFHYKISSITSTKKWNVKGVPHVRESLVSILQLLCSSSEFPIGYCTVGNTREDRSRRKTYQQRALQQDSARWFHSAKS